MVSRFCWPSFAMSLTAHTVWIPRSQRFIHTRLATWSNRSHLPSQNTNLPLSHSKFLVRSFGVSSPQYDSKTVIRVPPMAESITEGTLTQFSKQVGDFIKQDEELATIETDKIDVSVNAPHAGVVQTLLVGEGDTVTVDQAIAELQPQEERSADDHEQASQGWPRSASEPPDQKKDEPGHTVSRTPPVQAAHLPTPTAEHQDIARSPPKENTLVSCPSQQSKLRGVKPSRREERVKMTRIRQKTAQHLKESQNTAAFLTTFNEVDMSHIIEFRKKHRDAVWEKHGVKLGFMGAMARASILALKEIPAVNASIENGDTVLYRDYVDLSVAAAIPKGLVTPVLRNIESMSIVEIEKGISELVAKARDGKLTMDDLMGGTFTISNSGIWGSLFGTPIINMSQTAVLGTYGIQDRPVAVDGQVEIRPMMYIALTYDHCIIDGREGTTFLGRVKHYLENPESMLFQ